MKGDQVLKIGILDGIELIRNGRIKRRKKGRRLVWSIDYEKWKTGRKTKKAT